MWHFYCKLGDDGKWEVRKQKVGGRDILLAEVETEEEAKMEMKRQLRGESNER